jgi:hypothetical protein
MIIGKIQNNRKQIITDQDIDEIAKEEGLYDDLKAVEIEDGLYYLVIWMIAYKDVLQRFAEEIKPIIQ